MMPGKIWLSLLRYTTMLLPKTLLPVFIVLFTFLQSTAQQNLLLNGNFEDINNCAEYHSECGVEAWFYMNAIQVQLSHANNNDALLGNNTLTIFYTWNGVNTFYPVIGTLLPCQLQSGQRYTFSGVFTAQFNGRLTLRPGLAMGTHFYVPRRPFSMGIQPDSIMEISQIGNKDLYQFEYRFTATGQEKYLTFGTYIDENTEAGKRFERGKKETISVTVDCFKLTSDEPNEVACADFENNKKSTYNYDFRHKDMDYTLYAKGELPIKKADTGTGSVTTIKIPVAAPQPAKTVSDTILLGDVLFDFNQARLKPGAIEILQKIFTQKIPGKARPAIDSIYVEGHTDAIGSEAQNLQLSRRRSQSVKDWLLKEVILPAGKIAVHPFGKSRPVSTNSTPQGRALNRRVELIIFYKG
jgi:outer membrane protein OmpA-like peptidoglycan-associated protein